MRTVFGNGPRHRMVRMADPTKIETRMDASSPPPRSLFAAVALLAWALLPAPGRLNASLRDDAPSARDYDQIERGYYERLIDNDRRPEGPSRESHAPFDAGVLAQSVDDVREYVLKPGLVARHKGATWTTNALGMRDREYPDPKPPGTFRIALVGDSIAAGWGVDDGRGFEPVLERIWDERAREGLIPGAGHPPQGGRVKTPLSEDRIGSPPPLRGRVRVGGGQGRGTADGGTSAPTSHIQILNFAVPGHAPGQRWEHFSRVGWQTAPDLILFEGTLADLGWDERRLRALIPRGLGLDAPVYRDILNEIGISNPVAPDDLKARLRPHREAILLGVYRRVVADCRGRGIPVAWVLLPRVGKSVDPKDRARITHLAEAAGFDRIIDLGDAFDGLPATSLAIAVDDFHPNERGHAEFVRRIDAALAEFLSSSAESSRPLQ